MSKADIGLIGLAVMGQNLVLNMDDHGFTVAVYNRTTSKVDEFLNGGAKGTKVIGAHSLEELVGDAEEAPADHADGQGRQAGGRLHRETDPLLAHLETAATSSSTAATPTTRTASAAPPTSSRKGCSTSAPASPAARRARGTARPSCPAVAGRLAARQAHLPGHRRQGGRRHRPAATGWARTARATTSRWCTTASSTATCR